MRDAGLRLKTQFTNRSDTEIKQEIVKPEVKKPKLRTERRSSRTSSIHAEDHHQSIAETMNQEVVESSAPPIIQTPQIHLKPSTIPQPALIRDPKVAALVAAVSVRLLQLNAVGLAIFLR